jgi:O-antigen ligase
VPPDPIYSRLVKGSGRPRPDTARKAAPRKGSAGAGAAGPAGAQTPAAARKRGSALLRQTDATARFLLWTLLIVIPLLVIPGAKEAFRFPKLLLSEWLGLASLFFLAARLAAVPEVRWRELLRRPVVAATLPVLLAAGLGAFTTRHPLHFREATTDLWIAAACLVGWSLALPLPRLARFLSGLLIPGALLAVLGILQYHGMYRPLQFFGIPADSRLAVTSTAGNPGDLGSFLVLPCLAAQWMLARRPGGPWSWRDGVRIAALALCLYTLALTQTLAALLALAVGSLVIWGSRLAPRLRWIALAAGAAVLVLGVLALPPLRHRAVDKARQAAAGDWNSVLTGRLDGWRAAAYMFGEHPLAGVGHGAYRPEFVPAKLGLIERGTPFLAGQTQVVFANAHNEFLEVAAEWGIPGLAALGWALWLLVRALRRRRPEAAGEMDEGAARQAATDRAFAWAGSLGLLVLSLAQFPFRIALVAFPALLFLAWVLRRGDPAVDPAEEAA